MRGHYSCLFYWITFAGCAIASGEPRSEFPAGSLPPQQNVSPKKWHLNWVRKFASLDPAPKGLNSSQYHLKRSRDWSYEPVVMGKLLYLGSPLNDRLSVLDTDTGLEMWRFYCDGPIRHAPLVDGDRVWFGSDDGHVYCLRADNGKLLWKFRAVPSTRKLMASGRLLSVWPVRGGPVLANDTIYFTAGIFSVEGIFVFALEAGTGELLWMNNYSGYRLKSQPALRSVPDGPLPRGPIKVCGNELVVPLNKGRKASFDRTTGHLLDTGRSGKGTEPSSFVATGRTRKKNPEFGRPTQEAKSKAPSQAVPIEEWENGTIRLIEQIEGRAGTVRRVIETEENVILITREGRLCCFGTTPRKASTFETEKKGLKPAGDEWKTKVENLLKIAPALKGVALVWGLGSGRLVEELLLQTKLQITVVDPHKERIEALRRHLDEAGLYGNRATAHVGDSLSFGFPPYCANLITSEDLPSAGFEAGVEFIRKAYEALRPHGGAACFALPSIRRNSFAAWVREANLHDAEFRSESKHIILLRSKTPPAPKVPRPMGILWFDDPLSFRNLKPPSQWVLAMAPQPESFEQWTHSSELYEVPIGRVGFNFGAPGDRIQNGKLWLNHPFDAPSPGWSVEVEKTGSNFYRHSLWIKGGQGWPWVAASGIQGVQAVKVRGLENAAYSVRLHFAEPDVTKIGSRVFSVSLQNKTVWEDLDLVKETGDTMTSIVKAFEGILVDDGILKVGFTAKKGPPIICGLEIIPEGVLPGESP